MYLYHMYKSPFHPLLRRRSNLLKRSNVWLVLLESLGCTMKSQSLLRYDLVGDLKGQFLMRRGECVLFGCYHGIELLTVGVWFM